MYPQKYVSFYEFSMSCRSWMLSSNNSLSTGFQVTWNCNSRPDRTLGRLWPVVICIEDLYIIRNRCNRWSQSLWWSKTTLARCRLRVLFILYTIPPDCGFNGVVLVFLTSKIVQTSWNSCYSKVSVLIYCDPLEQTSNVVLFHRGACSPSDLLLVAQTIQFLITIISSIYHRVEAFNIVAITAIFFFLEAWEIRVDDCLFSSVPFSFRAACYFPVVAEASFDIEVLHGQVCHSSSRESYCEKATVLIPFLRSIIH